MRLTSDLVYSLGKALDVTAGDASNGDSAILGSVDRMLEWLAKGLSKSIHSTTHLLGQYIHLLGLQTSVCEHADLGRDVAPIVLAAQLLEVLLQQSAHGDDAIGHILDLAQPLLVQSRVVQDFGSDARTVNRRVGVERSYEDLDLRVDTLLLLDRFANNREGTDTFAVETLGLLAINLTSGGWLNIPCSWRSSERAQDGDPL